MKRHSLILVILLSVFAVVALFNCGSDSTTSIIPARSGLAGGWIVNPAFSNSLNFFVVGSTGAVTHHGFRSDSASILSSTEDTLDLVLVNGVTSYFINASMVNSTSGTYTTYPGMETGTITKIPDLTACSKMETLWTMNMIPGGTTSPYLSKPTRNALGIIAPMLYFEIDSDGDMSMTDPGNVFDITGGKMICSGTSPDDLVVGLLATNSVDIGVPYYTTVRFAGIVNGAASVWGLYDDVSGIDWPSGSFKMTSQCRMNGTVTYPDLGASGILIDGETYTIVIDTDAISGNGNEAATYNRTWSGTDTSDYSVDIGGVTPGLYYVYVESTDGATYFMYGWTGADAANYYHSPRTQVNIDCGTSLDLWMDIT